MNKYLMAIVFAGFSVSGTAETIHYNPNTDDVANIGMTSLVKDTNGVSSDRLVFRIFSEADMAGTDYTGSTAHGLNLQLSNQANFDNTSTAANGVETQTIFQLTATQPGTNLVWGDTEGDPAWGHSLGIGDINNHEDDDFIFEFFTENVYGFQFNVLDNVLSADDADDSVTVTLWNGDTLNMATSQFLHTSSESGDNLHSYRIISHGSAIKKIEFNESSDADDIALHDFATLSVAAPISGVEIDVQIYDTNNEVKPASNDLISIAIHSTNITDGDTVNFDAIQVDPATLKLGVGEASNVVTPWVDDWDSDTIADDIAFGFRTQDTGIFCDDEEVTLTGETYAGDAFTATDFINTIDCTNTSCHP